MLTYENFPPLPYLLSLLRTGPKLAWLYVQLWIARDENDHVFCGRSDVRTFFGMSPTLFRNHILELAEQGLILVKDRRDHAFELTMIDLDLEEFDSIQAP